MFICVITYFPEILLVRQLSLLKNWVKEKSEEK
jgi:hypothetical protein